MSTVDTPNKNSPYFGSRRYSHIFYINAHQFERYLVYLLNFEGGGGMFCTSFFLVKTYGSWTFQKFLFPEVAGIFSGGLDLRPGLNDSTCPACHNAFKKG